MSTTQDDNSLVHRYPDIPCPARKHERSILTFRNHTVAVLFCLPCERAWTEPITHPAIRALRGRRLLPLCRSEQNDRRKSRTVMPPLWP